MFNAVGTGTMPRMLAWAIVIGTTIALIVTLIMGSAPVTKYQSLTI